MIFQKDISNIIKGNTNNHSLLIKKLSLFFQHHLRYFSDFDDTITKNTCLLYSKFKFLSKKKHLSLEDIVNLLEQDFELNPAFEKKVRELGIQELVIVS